MNHHGVTDTETIRKRDLSGFRLCHGAD